MATIAENHSDTMDVVSSPPTGERPAPQLGKYKSFRKKYRKLKITFDELADEAAILFQKEHKLIGISKRLQEENDQLLEIVLDVNDSDKISSAEKFDLKQQPSGSHNARKRLEELMKIPKYTTPELLERHPDKRPVDLIEDDDGQLPGFLDASHEEAYLGALDASISTLPSTEHLPGDVEAIQPSSSQEKHAVTVHDFTKNCTASSYNWLKNHKPGALEGVGMGKEKESDRGASPKPKSKSKKGGKDKIFKEEPDPLDDDFAGELSDYPPATSRGKRKRDDDAYRPKGGSRSSKKSKKAKKASE